MDENKIIIIEDNETMRLGMADSMMREGYNVVEFENGAAALEYYKNNPVDLVITDLKMSPVDGLEVLKGVKKENPKAEVLMVSAFGTVETAVNAIKIGASDFLTKPFSPEELRMRVNKLKENLIQKNKIEQLTETNRTLQNDLSGKYENIISKSDLMNSLFQLIEKVAVEDSSVLIQGESGTGKELVAREIYLKSKRKDKPYIKVNCGALNDNLLESELFGH
ncbi:MAG: sigma-54-dependent Fis family transcriptional regulator, partial [Calditrichia bacterium]|nr:sigma-54-dependent Fis family transcriptional regulator [Calditrichia bacterium]